MISGASVSAMPIDFSTSASNITPPSEVMRPPSKAAVTFLRSTAGKLNGSRLSSSMAGVAASDSVEIGFDTQISASNQMLTLHPLANPCHALNKRGFCNGPLFVNPSRAISLYIFSFLRSFLVFWFG